MKILNLVVLVFVAHAFTDIVYATTTKVAERVEENVTEANTQQITLKEAFRSALQKTEVISIAKSRMQQAESKIDQSKSRFLPSVALEASFQQQDTVGVRSSLFGGRQSFSRLTLNQSLFEGGKDWAAIHASESDFESSRQSASVASYNLFASVARSFYGILSAKQDIDNLKKTIELAKERNKEIQSRARIGRSRNVDLIASQAQLSVLQAQLSAAEGDLQIAQDQFALMTGLNANSKLVTRRQQPQATKSVEHYLSLLDKRPDVASAKAVLESTKSQVSVAKSGHYPSLFLSGNYFLSRDGTQKGNDWDVGLSLSLPLFNGGLIKSQVSEANAKASESELLYFQTKRQAEISIRTAYNNLNSMLAQLSSLDTALKNTEQNYREQERNYRFGQATNLDVIQALNTFQDTKRTYDRTRFTALSAAIELKAAVADVSLAAVPQGED